MERMPTVLFSTLIVPGAESLPHLLETMVKVVKGIEWRLDLVMNIRVQVSETIELN